MTTAGREHLLERLTCIRPLDLCNLLRCAGRDHVPDPDIKELKAKIRFEVLAERPMPVLADGVAFGTTPVSFQLVPRAILFKL